MTTKETKNFKTVEVVREREREREHNFKELSFVCDAEKAYEIILKNNEIDARKIAMCQKDRLLYSRDDNINLLYDSLSFL